MITINNTNSDDQRYAEIYRVTISAMGAENYKKYYKDTGNRWLDIAKVWNRCYRKPLHAVFFYVFHKIFWGVYPDILLENNFRYLLTLVENEIMAGADAVEAWRRWPIYGKCLVEVLDAMESYGTEEIGIHFMEHYHYLSCRTRCIVLGSKQQGIKYGKDLIDCQMYKETISRLIPASTDWNSEKWGNDMNISSAIEDLYGVAYATSDAGQTDFDRIIRMLCCDIGRDRPDSDFCWYAANISELPVKMAKVIWPLEYEDVVVAVFLEAYKRTKAYIEAGLPYAWKKARYINPVGHYEMSTLKNSWLTKCILEWMANGKDFGSKNSSTRSAVFDLQMRA